MRAYCFDVLVAGRRRLLGCSVPLVRMLTSSIFLLAAPSPGAILGNVTVYTNQGHVVTVSCGTPQVRIDFWADDVVRVWLSPDGSFAYYDVDNSYLIAPGLAQFSGPTQFQVSDAGGYIKIQSSKLTVRVIKMPFGLEFYQADNQTLITATPPGQSLDTNVKAYLKRDASGQEEHFFGLQFDQAPVATLDRRGDTVTTALPPLWITRVNTENAGVRLTRYAAGNQTNIVQATTNLASAAFTDLSGPIVLPSGTGFITNYLDPTSPTNAAARFYRIRLGP